MHYTSQLVTIYNQKLLFIEMTSRVLSMIFRTLGNHTRCSRHDLMRTSMTLYELCFKTHLSQFLNTGPTEIKLIQPLQTGHVVEYVRRVVTEHANRVGGVTR